MGVSFMASYSAVVLQKVRFIIAFQASARILRFLPCDHQWVNQLMRALKEAVYVLLLSSLLVGHCLVSVICTRTERQSRGKSCASICKASEMWNCPVNSAEAQWGL